MMHRQEEPGPGSPPRQQPQAHILSHRAPAPLFPYPIKDGFPGVRLFPKISMTLIHFNLPGTQ